MALSYDSSTKTVSNLVVYLVYTNLGMIQDDGWSIVPGKSLLAGKSKSNIAIIFTVVI
jgi:hypothetical protein